MPKLGIGSSLTRAGLTKPGIVTDSLVLKHNYAAGGVVPVSDGACKFNGTSDYIAIGAKPVDTADATYCFWAKSDAGSASVANRGLFAHGDQAIGGFGVNHDSGRPLLYLAATLFQYWVDTGYAYDGKWHHWAVVVDVDDMEDGCKLYIDGVEIAHGSRDEAGTVVSYGNLEIGRSNATYEYEGYLCNFGVWSGLLSQAEIKSIMWKNYADLSTEEKAYKGDLVSWWNMDEGTGTSVADSHGSNDGTFT